MGGQTQLKPTAKNMKHFFPKVTQPLSAASMTSSLCHHCFVKHEALGPALLSPPIYYWGYPVATPPSPHDTPQSPVIPASLNPASETTSNPELISFPLALPQNPSVGTQAFPKTVPSPPRAHLPLKSAIHSSSGTCLLA